MGRGKLLLADPSCRSFASPGEGSDLGVDGPPEKLVSVSLSDLKIDPYALRVVTEDQVPSLPSSAPPCGETSCCPSRHSPPAEEEETKNSTSHEERTDLGPSVESSPSTDISTPDAPVCPPSSSSSSGKSPQSATRHRCPSCKRSRSYWCGECLRPIGSPEALACVPRVELPLTFHIIRHPKEKVMKSSAIPLSILAPHQVYIHYFPHIPPLFSPDQASSSKNAELPPHAPPSSHSGESSPSSLFYLLVPGEDSQPLEEITDWRKTAGFVLLDCTWFQVHGMCQHPDIRRLPKVALKGKYTSIFWRQHVHNSPYFLSTAECVYFVLRVYDEAVTRHREATQREGAPATQEERKSTKSRLESGRPHQDEEEGLSRETSSDQKEDAPLGGVSDATARRSNGQDEYPSKEHPETAAYDGKYDNILFYFVLCYQIILKDQQKRLGERREATRTGKKESSF